MLSDMDIVAWSLDGLHPADVMVKHSFDLTNDSPIYTTSRRIPPRNNELVCYEINKMLAAGITTPSRSAWSFQILTAGENKGKERFLFTIGSRTFE